MDGPKCHEILEEFMAMVSMSNVHIDKRLHDYDQHLGGGLLDLKYHDDVEICLSSWPGSQGVARVQ